MNADEFRQLEVLAFKKAMEELPPPGRLSSTAVKMIHQAFEVGWNAGRDFEYAEGHQDPGSGSDRPGVEVIDDDEEEVVHTTPSAIDVLEDVRRIVVQQTQADLSLLDPHTHEGRVVLAALNQVLSQY
jgi:hypothetical protein